MQCPKCGNNNADDSIFCSACGYRLVVAEGTDEHKELDQSEGTISLSVNSITSLIKNKVFIIVVCLALLIGVGFFVLLKYPRSPLSTAANGTWENKERKRSVEISGDSLVIVDTEYGDTWTGTLNRPSMTITFDDDGEKAKYKIINDTFVISYSDGTAYSYKKS